jgi:hypothetical protein
LGHYFSFASIEAKVNGLIITGITSIDYSSKLEVGDVYGTKSQKLGTTRGKQSAEASMEMYLQDWENLRATLGAGGVGYGEPRFAIVVQYAEIATAPVKTDVLEGCRVTSVDYTNADGTDAAKVKLGLNVMRVFEGMTSHIVASLGVAF